MEDRGPWRAFEAAAWRGCWGVESEDPDLIDAGDEVIIYPKLTESEAREKAASLNSGAAK